MTNIPPKAPAPKLVLASASQSRARLLAQVGLEFEIQPAHIDEESVKTAMLAEGARHSQIAETLAEIKCLQVSQKCGAALVIGADQILSCNNLLYSKAQNFSEAHDQLTALAGWDHQLVTAACVGQNGGVIWRHVETARLKMRAMSEGFIRAYLAAGGEALLTGVGCYRLEERGALLFERISGDYYGILGLPLLPLLQLLRDHKVLAV